MAKKRNNKSKSRLEKVKNNESSVAIPEKTQRNVMLKVIAVVGLGVLAGFELNNSSISSFLVQLSSSKGAIDTHIEPIKTVNTLKSIKDPFENYNKYGFFKINEILDSVHVSPPKIEILDDEVKFSKPDGLDVTEEEFRRISHEFANKFINELKKHIFDKNGGDLFSTVHPFLNKLPIILKEINPKTSKHITDYVNKLNSRKITDQKKIVLFADYFNHYLRLENILVHFRKSKTFLVNEILSSEYVRINEVKHVNYHLGDGFLNFDNKDIYLNGQYNYFLDVPFSVVLEEDREEEEDNYKKLMKVFNFDNKNFTREFYKNYLNKTTFRHEQIHAHFFYLFPDVFSKFSLGKSISCTLSLEHLFKNQKNAINVLKSPMLSNISEVSGYSITLLNNDLAKISHYDFFTEFFENEYSEISSLVSFLTIFYAKESELKVQIIENILAQKTLIIKDVSQLLVSSHYDSQTSEKVGEAMYKLSYFLFKAVNDGRLKLVK